MLKKILCINLAQSITRLCKNLENPNLESINKLLAKTLGGHLSTESCLSFVLLCSLFKILLVQNNWGLQLSPVGTKKYLLCCILTKGFVIYEESEDILSRSKGFVIYEENENIVF